MQGYSCRCAYLYSGPVAGELAVAGFPGATCTIKLLSLAILNALDQQVLAGYQTIYANDSIKVKPTYPIDAYLYHEQASSASQSLV